MEKRLIFLHPFALDPKNRIFSLTVQSSWIFDDLRRGLRNDHFRDHNLGDIKVFILSQYLDYPHTPDPSKLVTDSENPTYNGISLAEFSPVEKILKRFPTVTEDNEQIQMIVYVTGGITSSVPAPANLESIKEELNDLDELRGFFAHAHDNPMPIQALEFPSPPPEVSNAIQVAEDEETPSLSELMDVDPDVNESHEVGSGVEEITPPRVKTPDPMVVFGVNGDTDSIGDLLPNPTFLQSFLTEEDILVRADYLRIYKAINTIYEALPQRSASLVVLLGQPGIGKTMWMHYAMHRRIQLDLPFIWYRSGRYYRFTKQGVVVDPDPQDFAVGSTKPHWCFIDASDALQGLPAAMSGTGRYGVFPIYVTSPKESRWKDYRQSKDIHYVMMNPWSWKEIELTRSQIYSHLKKADVKKRFYDLGPTARLCLHNTDSTNETFREDRSRGINRLDLKTLRVMMEEPAQSSLDNSVDSLSHKIILIRRRNNNVQSNDKVVEFMSTSVLYKLVEVFLSRSDAALAELWHLMSDIGKIGVLTGMFELHNHDKFQKRIRMTLQPMEFKLSRFHLRGDSDGIKIEFEPTEYRVYKKKEKVEVQEHGYYRPVDPNQVAIDSFFVHHGILYLLQHTVGKTHGVKAGLVKFIKRCLPRGFHDSDRWHFVFVIPDTTVEFNAGPDARVSNLKYSTATLPFGARE